MAQEIKKQEGGGVIETRSPRCEQKWIVYSTAFWGEAGSVDGPSLTGLRRRKLTATSSGTSFRLGLNRT
jgi:hypothetical protein